MRHDGNSNNVCKCIVLNFVFFSFTKYNYVYSFFFIYWHCHHSTYIPELAVPLMIVIGTKFGISVCIKIFILPEENKCMWNKKIWCDDLFFIILCWFFPTWSLKLELESESYNTDFIKICTTRNDEEKEIHTICCA